MIRKLFYLLIVITTNVTAQTAGMMNVKLKTGTSIPYAFTSVSGLTFSGVQGKDTLNINLKSGSPVQYSISLLDGINFSNNQSTDSIYILLKGGDLRKYAISTISALSFTGWDKITSNETLKPETEKRNNLGQNYPNPFNLSTTIPYYLPKQENITITVSTITGRIIASLIQEQQDAGMHQVTWYASAVSGGIYFYRLQGRDYMETKKMVLLK